MKREDWADRLGEWVYCEVYHRDQEDGMASKESIASMLRDFVSENFTEISEWAFAGHCHYEWQAHQLSCWVKTLPPETVPETVRKCAEAKP